tara:strand:- start:708 stop:1340 length:633 start_codon:yes stop_codon:yes gene_type:complete
MHTNLTCAQKRAASFTKNRELSHAPQLWRLENNFGRKQGAPASSMLSCCNDEQSFFLVTFVFYLLAVRILWFSKIMKPFKLWTTFMHEFSHALAAWATCNKVTGIEVNENEGGLTHWKGPQKRMRCSSHFVLPAGYLGSTAWGVAIILSCVGRLSAQVMGCILVAALALCLLFALFGKTNEQHRSRSKVPDRSGGGAAPLTALRARDEPC